MNQPDICRSIFKDGETHTTVKAYTDIWIRLINQLERSGGGFPGPR